jgi:hypothetical protein
MKNHPTAINNREDTSLTNYHAVAYHLAGQAVAICLGNSQKRLPDVHFSLILDQTGQDGQSTEPCPHPQGECIANIEGGRLIQHLPLSLAQALQELTNQQQRDEYKRAFEADLINLLTGFLAEEKYIAMRDGKTLHADLLTITVGLRFNDSNPGTELAVEYMDCFLFDKKDYDRLNELFLDAYKFVNNKLNWFAISSLADQILSKSVDCFNFEDVISLLESRMAA